MELSRVSVANNPRATVDALWSDPPFQFVNAIQLTLEDLHIIESETVELQFRFKLENGKLTAEQFGTYRILESDPAYPDDAELIEDSEATGSPELG